MMVFSSWLRTLTYIFYCIILVYKLSLLDWGILFGFFGSYESFNKEDSSPFIITTFALSLKSSFSSCKDKKAFETWTELICNLLDWWPKSTMIYKKTARIVNCLQNKTTSRFNMPWFDFALLYHFIILNYHKTKTKLKIKKKNQCIKTFFFFTVKDTPINIERK